MNHARTLTSLFAAAGVERSGPDAIYFVAEDDGNVQCFTEVALDGWWENLSPERKAEIFERDLDGDPADLRLHETLGRFSLTEVVSRIQRLSDTLAEAIERPYTRPVSQVRGEVEARAEAHGSGRRLAERSAVSTLLRTRTARLDHALVQLAPAERTDHLGVQGNEANLPSTRHPESLNPSPVDAVEHRRA